MNAQLTFEAPWGPEVVRYVPCRDGWHVYITDHDPFPALWAPDLGAAIAKGRKLAAELGYHGFKEKLVDYK